MPTVSFETNMKCQSCLSKVGPRLDAEPAIQRWDVDLNDPRKTVRAEVRSTDDSDIVAQSIRDAGFEAKPLRADVATGTVATSEAPLQPEKSGSDEMKAPDDAQHGDHSTEAKQLFQWSTYKPLALVVAYIVGGTVFAESFYDQFAWSRAMTWFMGFFFVAFAFFKLLDVSKFADAFATYDVIGRRSRIYGLSYPFIELGLGLLFLSGHFLLAANVLTLFIMAIGLVGVIGAVRKKQTIQCACLGTVFNLPMSIVTIVENSTMILMAAAMIWKLL
ncbi:MAG: hypothetical protein Fues2KO_34250 [Fuerstiella sp.]